MLFTTPSRHTAIGFIRRPSRRPSWRESKRRNRTRNGRKTRRGNANIPTHKVPEKLLGQVKCRRTLSRSKPIEKHQKLNMRRRRVRRKKVIGLCPPRPRKARHSEDRASSQPEISKLCVVHKDLALRGSIDLGAGAIDR